MLFNFKYKFLRSLRVKQLLFWDIAFPIILGTVFFTAFKNADNYQFSPIKVAIVNESENKAFETVINEVSKEDDEQLLNSTDTDEENAKNMLADGNISGIIYIKDSPSITISQNGIEQSILQSFMQQYKSRESVITQIAKEHPENLASAIEKLTSDISYNKEVSLNNENMSHSVVYFYSLIAMTCLFSAMSGVYCTLDLLANQSAVGIRREASPQHKMKAVMGDYAATVLLHFGCILILLFYLNQILKVDFGNKMPLIIITGFLGCVIGSAIGVLIGSIKRLSEGVKVGISVSFSMLCSLFSGLMLSSLKLIIDENIPVLNRLNPAALITDSLYSLNMYSDYSRYTTNMITLVIIAAVCCILSYFSLRRTSYANL